MHAGENPPILSPGAKKLVVAATLLVSTCILLILDFAFDDDLMAASIRLSIYLQKLNLETFSIVFSFVVLTLGLILFFLFAFHTEDKRQAFPLVFGFMVCSWFHGFSKLLFMDGRPSFYSKELRSDRLFCVAEFGKPSGHALFSFYIFLCLGRFLEQRYFRGHTWKIMACFFLNCLVACTIGLTRFYFGVHSVNQILLGAYFGGLIFFLATYFDDHLRHLVFDPMLDKSSRNRKQAAVFALLAAFCTMFVLLLVVYLRAHSSLASDNSFRDGIINCLQVKENLVQQFTVVMHLNSLYFAMFNFWFLGLLFCPQDVASALDFGFDGHPGMFLLRTAVYCLPFGVSLILRVALFGNPTLQVAFNTLVLCSTGFLVGRYMLSGLEALGIPLKKPEHSSDSKSLEAIEMTDFNA